jgi:glycosyltransferase involved in cell wall biosynthesis
MTTPALMFMWEQFGAYHVDRLEALAAACGDDALVIGIEVASTSATYAWPPIRGEHRFVRHTLFPDRSADDIAWWRKLRGLLRQVLKYRPRAVFLCNQEQPEVLAAVMLLRLFGVRTYAMLDAKFDDSPRRVLKESLKPLVLRCYSGGLVAGARHRAYYRFLGLPKEWCAEGYDTVSVERVRREAGAPLAPDGIAHAGRDFVVVARFVPKKNIPLAIRAFALLQQRGAADRRRLLLCGSGSLEPELRRLVAELGVRDVVFTGFLSPEDVCRTLARALALILPSIEEQWGLVVNEAVALGVPVLCSDNVGARDTLVRSGVNGFTFEPHNHEGLANHMQRLSENEAEWRQMSLACRRFAPLGDVAEFVRGVARLTRTPAHEQVQCEPA